jgi:FAD/FMN-containing dehydrogenase
LPAFLNFPVSSPKVFALPASIEEAAQVLRLASRNRWTVVPAGKCSWLDAGNPLTGADVLIGTWRLNRIIEHEPADLIAITEAGVLLRDLNHRLMQEGQWLPIDATGHGEGTIGGIIATGTSGPQRSGYGPTRGFVIGLKVLLADGSLIKAGGRVVKNVAGYDLCKLFTGSYGTLGLIVEANFKLRPRPELEASVLASGPPGSLIAVAQMILKLPLFPAAVEMLSHTDLLRTEQPVLLTRFAGNDKTVKAQTENACTILKSANDISNVRVIENDSDIWERLALPLTTSKGVSWRAHVPPALLPGLIDLVYRSHNGAGDMMRWQAGIADGRLQAGGEFEPETNVDVLSKLRDECRRYKGSLFIENAPRQIKEQFPAWGEFGNSTFVMQRIKQQLDPEGILSPGRFGF